PYAWPIRAEALALGATDEPPSPRPAARPWSEKGIAPFGPAWVDLETSIQWRLFRRTVEVLRGRGNRVFVVVGPFNEHMLTEKSLEAYKQRTSGVAAWLGAEGVPFAVPDALPTEMYADASHPLASGYRLLAERLAASDAFRRFVAREGAAP
ncbi:MAG: SGNH/GDSL hydrolase family protein, partial [Planctomycetes bacterium]|nr:SGNH/GDSL hydrolase family protein [Planctomycetota bacterium]